MLFSIKRAASVLLLAGAVSGAFCMGQKLGTDTGRPLRSINHLISATAGTTGPFGATSGTSDGQDNSVPPAEIFETVLDHIKRDFVENSGGDLRLSNGALNQMFASLDDPRTNFLDVEPCKARQAALDGSYYGIGAVLTITRGKKQDIDYRYLTVMDVLPASPAAKSGLQSGDRITEIDGHWIIAYSIASDWDRIRKEAGKDEDAKRSELTPIMDRFKAGYTVARALDRLAQGEGKSYRLTVERHGQTTPLKIDITTALTRVEPVTYRTLNRQVGYLRVRQFNQRATDQFTQALAGIGDDIKGLVLDLRQNPGGVTAEASTGLDGYSSARALIARLTRGGKVATIERRANQREPLIIEPATPNLHVPLVVLVDAGTANLSEMVAAALHDVGRARLVGTHTFGDDVLQLFAPLKNGTGVEIVTAHLLTAGGTDLAKGLTPDITIIAERSGSSDDARPDTTLERAIDALTGA